MHVWSNYMTYWKETLNKNMNYDVTVILDDMNTKILQHNDGFEMVMEKIIGGKRIKN